MEALFDFITKNMAKNKRGQAGVISGLIFGVASLVIGVIIAFVVVSTLTGANLLQDNRETVTVSNELISINETGHTLAGASASRLLSGSFTLTNLSNYSDGTTILLANATVSNAGVVTNLTDPAYQNATVDYTYTLKTNEEVATDRLSGNFTGGVDNVSSKIPTVLLVAAIVLILGVLTVLVFVWQRMRLGGDGFI